VVGPQGGYRSPVGAMSVQFYCSHMLHGGVDTDQRLSYGRPWAHYLGGYQDRLLGGPLGLPDLCYTTPDGVRRKDHGGEVLG
jgi:hypothetical protein